MHRGSGPVSLVFDYLDDSGPVSFNVYDAKTDRWRYGLAAVDRRGTGTWKQATIALPYPGSPRVVLGPVVGGDPLTVRDAHLVAG